MDRPSLLVDLGLAVFENLLARCLAGLLACLALLPLAFPVLGSPQGRPGLRAR